MPVTKTAKRALRSSSRKASFNKIITSKLESAIRIAKKSGKEEDVRKVFSLADRSAKKKLIHKNKAARIKSRLIAFLAKKFGEKLAKKRKVVKKVPVNKASAKKAMNRKAPKS
jgi:small subunit ribosomal protein S20